MATDEQLAALAGLATANLPDKTPKAERERWIFFFARRGAYLIRSEGWAPGSPQMLARLKDERDAITAFLTDELGTGAGSLVARTPHHLDLTHVCKQNTGDKDADVKPTVTRATQDRKDRVKKIAIRALAAQFDLWETGAGGKPAIKRDATREIIDRRLRMVERMLFNVNGGRGNGRWKAASAESWADGFRTRVFEYPTTGQNPKANAIKQAADRSGVALPLHEDAGAGPYKQTIEQQWDWLADISSDGNTVLNLTWDNPPPYPETQSSDDPNPINAAPGKSVINTRMPTKELRWAFKVSPDRNYALRFFPQPAQAPAGQALTLSQAIDSLVGDPATPKTDYWDRAWMNCDHVLAALHIEALLFARRRRIGTAAADAEIDALASFTPPGALLHPKAYVWLDAIPNEALNPDTSGELHGGLLDGRPGNTYFRTLLKEPDAFTRDNDFEIGDQIVFYNTAIYDLVTNGVWRLENATVTDVGADEQTGKLDVNTLKFSGHGLGGDLNRYTQEFVDTINNLLDGARGEIEAAAGATVVTLHTGHHAIRWEPYPLSPAAVATIGPWWLVYPLKDLKRPTFETKATSPAAAVLIVPGTFAVPTGPGAPTVITGTRPAGGGPPTTQTIVTGPGFTLFNPAPLGLTQDQLVLFPLTEPSGINPNAGDTMPAWGRYLTMRALKQVDTTLVPLVADSSHIPGLFHANGTASATSPKVRL